MSARHIAHVQEWVRRARLSPGIVYRDTTNHLWVLVLEVVTRRLSRVELVNVGLREGVDMVCPWVLLGDAPRPLHPVIDTQDAEELERQEREDPGGDDWDLETPSPLLVVLDEGLKLEWFFYYRTAGFEEDHQSVKGILRRWIPSIPSIPAWGDLRQPLSAWVSEDGEQGILRCQQRSGLPMHMKLCHMDVRHLPFALTALCSLRHLELVDCNIVSIDGVFVSLESMRVHGTTVPRREWRRALSCNTHMSRESVDIQYEVRSFLSAPVSPVSPVSPVAADSAVTQTNEP
jgi:hypothetical protein